MEDVGILPAERVHRVLEREEGWGPVIVDRPGGGRKEERAFLAFWESLLASGTRYVQFSRFALNVLTRHARHIRLLQLADLVTSCTTAMVAGKARYAGEVFPLVQEILDRDAGGQVYGYGLKIYPERSAVYQELLGEVRVRRRFP